MAFYLKIFFVDLFVSIVFLLQLSLSLSLVRPMKPAITGFHTGFTARV